MLHKNAVYKSPTIGVQMICMVCVCCSQISHCSVCLAPMCPALWSQEQSSNCRFLIPVCSQELARSRDGLQYFLTYADNAAVGYFEKQGFSTQLTLPREQVCSPEALKNHAETHSF